MDLPSSVVGVGVDIVDIDRFTGVIERTPTFVDRIFTVEEATDGSGKRRSAQSLAARFAAKEAVAKVLVRTHGLEWHHCEVIADASGDPSLRITGTVATAAEALGINRWRHPLSHDGGHAIAYVVAEGVTP